jgi:hypothetical protein
VYKISSLIAAFRCDKSHNNGYYEFGQTVMLLKSDFGLLEIGLG